MGQNTYHTIRLILGDQLNHQHSWYQEKRSDCLYVMMECLSETNYVKHHIQKIVGFFLAMRHFAEHLEEAGHEVCYLSLDDAKNRQDFTKNLQWLIKNCQVKKVEYQLPDEYRLDQTFAKWGDQLDVEVQAYDTEHFLTGRSEMAEFFEGKKQYLMESFYRMMRKKYDILMKPDGKTPLTGRWNYDATNRKKLPAKVKIPPQPDFLREVKSIVKILKDKEVETIGQIDEARFNWPVTRGEGLQLLADFIKNRLIRFGDFQDAMTVRDGFLFHSRLSFVLNVKLLHPLEVVEKSVDYWKEHQDNIDISQLEGFIRQIIGWREYMRGIYWAKMPGFAEMNFFEHQAKLPAFYWTANTNMNCLHHAIEQSLDKAYAHHIQRLMVTGNFALLLGVDPDEVDQWYLGIYIDAIEWVEITNTRGMSQFADGGIVGTKPYVSSANYIHKMSDYCKDCHYDKKKKYGEKACPFNSLYWDFYDRHQEKLGNNPRIGMMYRVWNRMDAEERSKILEQAAEYKGKVDEL